MKLHIFRLSGHDFVHYRKIEIGANDRAVYQQSISCFIVYANFDWFLINLLLTLYFINKKNGRFYTPEFLLKPVKRFSLFTYINPMIYNSKKQCLDFTFLA